MRVEDFITQTGARYVYHFTSTANLPSIREHGLLSYSKMRRLGITPAAPGGDESSRATDERRGLHNFVHLCFLPEHPMEYVRRPYLGATRFLKINVHVLSGPGVRGCSKLANSGDAVDRPIEDVLDDLPLRILCGGSNGAALREPYEDYDRARRFEILVPYAVPLGEIENP